MRCNAKYRRNVYAWLNIENQENVFVTDINKKKNPAKKKLITTIQANGNKYF